MSNKKVNTNYFMQRFSEPSTWRGILAILTACGIAVSPEQAEKIVAGGLALMGLVGAFSPDKKKPTT